MGFAGVPVLEIATAKLHRLRRWADWVDGSDDGAVVIPATCDRCQDGSRQSKPEGVPGCSPEGLDHRPNGAPEWPRLGTCFCFDSC